jgi:hypothetical protein
LIGVESDLMLKKLLLHEFEKLIDILACRSLDVHGIEILILGGLTIANSVARRRWALNPHFLATWRPQQAAHSHPPTGSAVEDPAIFSGQRGIGELARP